MVLQMVAQCLTPTGSSITQVCGVTVHHSDGLVLGIESVPSSAQLSTSVWDCPTIRDYEEPRYGDFQS